jgi:hypothetical protein
MKEVSFEAPSVYHILWLLPRKPYSTPGQQSNQLSYSLTGIKAKEGNEDGDGSIAQIDELRFSLSSCSMTCSEKIDYPCW